MIVLSDPHYLNMATVDLPVLRRRGAIKARIAKLTTKVAELEGRESDPSISTHAQQLFKRLGNLDSDYKTCHFAVIDVLDDEQQLADEQETLDNHDDEVADLDLRIQALMVAAATPPPPITTTTDARPLTNCAILERRSVQLQARLVTIHEKIGGLKDDGSEVHLVYLYQEYLADLKRDLSEFRNEILTITADTSDMLMSNTQKQEDNIFDMSIKIKKLLFLNPTSSETVVTSPTATLESRAVKLPKIDVPTFDGELLHWQTFWEQFSISVDKAQISPTLRNWYTFDTP